MNNKSEKIRIYLLNHELETKDIDILRRTIEEYGAEIVPLKIDRSIFDTRYCYDEKWSIEAYYRLLLFDLLPDDVDRLLYLDVDMIINNSIVDFYNSGFENNNIWVCENANGYIDPRTRFNSRQMKMFAPMLAAGSRYFNSGMMLMNVGRMRGSYNFEVYRKAMEEWNYEMVAYDQDILNYVHWREAAYADSRKYNYQGRIAHVRGMTYEKAKDKMIIIHYSDEKPWETRNYHYPIEKIWWDYAKYTPFYHELMESFIDKTMFNPEIQLWLEDLTKQVEDVTDKLKEMMSVIKQMKEFN